MGHEVYNKTLGIIGIGRVGSVVADRALGLKMHVIAFDPFISPQIAENMGITLVTLEDIYRRSDFISHPHSHDQGHQRDGERGSLCEDAR